MSIRGLRTKSNVILSDSSDEESIKDDRTILDISNQNKKGELDLDIYSNLIELNCQNNLITSIINIPQTLKYLNCSHNKISFFENLPNQLEYLNCSHNNIKELDNLPDNLEGLNCKSNPITHLYYPFNIKPKSYPKTLTHLTFGKKFNQSVDNLTNNLKYLTFGTDSKWGGSDFNMELNLLPESIISLTFLGNCKFKRSFENLPKSIKTLNLSGDYPLSINTLPDSIENLILNCKEDFNGDYGYPPICCKEKIYKLPNKLKKLEICAMGDIEELDFSDLKKLHKKINSDEFHYSW